MSPNCDALVETTKLFVEQIRSRPVQVVANLNCLLEDSGIQLEIVRPKEPQTPAEASLFDHLPPQEQMRIEEGGAAA